MSRLANRIRAAGSSQGRSMGFGSAGGGDERAIIVVATATSVDEARAAVEAGADAISFSGAVSDVVAVVEAAGDTPVGLTLEAATGDDISAATEAGADFFTFDDGQASPDVLRVEGIGRVVILGDDQSEEAVRPLAGLRLDAVLIEGAEAPTVRAQLALRQLASWLGAPLMVGTAGSDVAELTALRDAGAGAILARGDLAATLAAADEVPPPPRVRDSVAPLVPPPSSNGHDHDDEDF